MPGRPCCARGTPSASPSARSTGWSRTPRSWSPRGGWRRGPWLRCASDARRRAEGSGKLRVTVRRTRLNRAPAVGSLSVRVYRFASWLSRCVRRCAMGLGPEEGRTRRERDVASLLSQISYLEEEISLLRRKVADSPRQVRVMEERIAEAEGRAAFLSERNDKLAGTLREAREQLVTLKEEVDRLGQPPSGYGVFLIQHDDGTVDVFTGGRKLRVSLSPNVELDDLHHRQGGMLNEAVNILGAWGVGRAGGVVLAQGPLGPIDGVTPRALVIGHTD